MSEGSSIVFERALSCGMRLCVCHMTIAPREGQYMWSVESNGKVIYRGYHNDSSVAYHRMLVDGAMVLNASREELNDLQAVKT